MRRVLCLGLLLCAATVAAQEDHWQKLFEVNQRFAQAGSKEGQFKLAEMYEQGVGTPVDEAKARHWYDKAAQQGHEEAARRIADWDSYLSARKRQAEAARQAEQRDKAQAAREAAQRADEERARLAQQHAEQERAQKAAAQKRAEQQAAQAKQRRAEEQARAAAQRRAEAKETVRHEPPAAPPTPAESPAPAATVAAPAPAEAAAPNNFESDPCKTPAARFMSTCRGK